MSDPDCRFPGRPHQYFSNPVTAKDDAGTWHPCPGCDAVERNKLGPVRDDPTSLTVDKIREAAARLDRARRPTPYTRPTPAAAGATYTREQQATHERQQELHRLHEEIERQRRPNPPPRMPTPVSHTEAVSALQRFANAYRYAGIATSDPLPVVEDTDVAVDEAVRPVTITPDDIEEEIRQYHADHDGDETVQDHGTALRIAVLEGRVGKGGYRQIAALTGKVSADGTPPPGESADATNERVAGDLVAQAVERARDQITKAYALTPEMLYGRSIVWEPRSSRLNHWPAEPMFPRIPEPEKDGEP